MTLELHCADVHLWCTFFDEIRDEALLSRYRRLLSPEEQHRQSRFVLARDRHRDLVTRALLRTMLSQYADVAPASWTFTTNAFGRPEIASRHTGARGISFNVSHTNSLIVLGVARERAVGVDTENARVHQLPMNVARRFFAVEELAALSALPEDLQRRRFVEYWTLKESYVKARGMGFSLPLHRFGFRFVGDRHVAMFVDRDQGDSPSRWHFGQLSIAGDYATAVCAERIRGDVPRVTVKKVVPLGTAHELHTRWLRASPLHAAPCIRTTCA